jgi:hypothetical protein
VDEKLMDERCATLSSNKQKLVTLLLMDEKLYNPGING